MLVGDSPLRHPHAFLTAGTSHRFADLRLIYATDSIEDAIAHIRSKAIEPFGLKRVTRARRSFPWLGERGLSGM
jgi:hypothetical protein